MAISQSDDNIDVELVEIWQRFVQILLAILVLTGAGMMAYYSR